MSGFTASLTTYYGDGLANFETSSAKNACPFDAGVGDNVCTTASGHLVSYSSTSFTLGSSVFVLDTFVPSATLFGGAFPLPTTPSSIYVIGRVVNHATTGGTLSAGAGSFGGALGTGGTSHYLLGLSPLPSVFGSITLPFDLGNPGTTTTTAQILANLVQMTLGRTSWTTGTITFNDGNLGTTATGLGPAIPFVTSGTVVGSNHLGPNGGTISLVTPFTLRTFGDRTHLDLRAGYAVLSITFLPEPGTLMLIGAGAVLLVTRGRRRQG